MSGGATTVPRPCEYCDVAEAKAAYLTDLVHRLLQRIPDTEHSWQPEQDLVAEARAVLVAAGRRVKERKMWEDR